MPGHPLWNNAVLAMHMQGDNGTTAFNDLKGSAFSSFGIPTISTAQSVFGGSSARFDGATYIFSGASNKWLVGALDFHLSMWVWIDQPSAVDSGGTRPALLVGVGSPSTTNLRFSLLGDSVVTGLGVSFRGSGSAVDTPFPIFAHTWNFLSVDRFEGKVYLGLNGEIKSIFDYPGNVGSNTEALFIGGRTYSGSNMRFYGHIEDLLFFRGAALHTQSFTVPGAPFNEGFEVFPKRVDRPSALLTAFKPAWRASPLARSARLIDLENDGIARIIGTTKNHGSPDYPVSRRVRLFRKRDGRLVRETWSDAAGNYAFEHLRHDIDYCVVSYDHTGLYNAAISDSVALELMP